MRTLSHSLTDSYVKVTLFSASGKQVAKSKTTIRKSMADPEYNESFMYEISERDLQLVNLNISVIVITKARKKKEIGRASCRERV